MTQHFEFTGETQPLGNGRMLHRIRATRDLPQHVVRAGDLGGWLESERNLSGTAWVSGAAQVSGDARVSRDARVSGAARVYGNAQVYGAAQVYGTAQVSGTARVYGAARVYGNALIERTDHVLTVTPIGSEGVTATLFRTDDGHTLAVGCWDNGTLEALAAEVERRAENWGGSDLDHEVWRAQYDALHALGVATVKRWSE